MQDKAPWHPEFGKVSVHSLGPQFENANEFVDVASGYPAIFAMDATFSCGGQDSVLL
jgi:hypothetical protein